MEGVSWVKTFPGANNFSLFESLPSKIYPPSSPYFKSLNTPQFTFLEGCYVMLLKEVPVGRFALYQNPYLKHKGQPAIALGSYECIDNHSVAEVLLAYAKTNASKMGCSWLLGPMEGSTFNNYRFSKSWERPLFFMEPYHHLYYNQQFVKAGFKELASYYSAENTEPDYNAEKLAKFEQYFVEKGAVFRNINLKNLRDDLLKIAQFNEVVFSKNKYYTPIPIQAFADKYARMESYLNPDLIWILEDKHEEMHAFAFAIPDYFDVKEETVIVKSVACKGGSPFKGAGSFLSGKINQVALQSGYKKLIHAFMLKSNESTRISNKYGGNTIREYALYGKKL